MSERKTIIRPAWLELDDDGALRSRDYGDVYFQPADGPAESTHVFLDANDLADRFHALDAGGAFTIGELGFGTGLNFLLAWELFRKAAPEGARLHFVSFEKHPVAPEDLPAIHAHWPELAELSGALRNACPQMLPGMHRLSFDHGRVTLSLCFGDVAELLPETRARVDAWFLDGFAPAKNEDMWAETLFAQIARRTAENGTAATFSVASHVRRGLRAAGFDIEKIPGYGRKREMLAAKLANAPKRAVGAEDGLYACPYAPGVKTAIVIGAGVAGCATAYALSRQGVAVTVIDRADAPGAETSGNPAGAVYPKLSAAPSPQGDFYRHAFAHAVRLFAELGPEVFEPCGVLHLDTDADAAARHAKIADTLGLPEDFVRHLDASEASAIAGIALETGGLFYPGGGRVRPPALCRALLDGGENIETRFGVCVTDVRRDGDAWRALDESGAVIAAADVTVIAAGHGLGAFGQLDGFAFETLRGQVTFLPADDASRNLKTVLCHDGYIPPALDGVHHMGATFEKSPPGDPALRAEDHAENLEKLARNVPALAATARLRDDLSGRVGWRVAAPDRLPLVGPAPVFADMARGEAAFHDGLYLAAAFGSHGMTTAPLAGELIAAMITGAPLPLPDATLRHILPARFPARRFRRSG